MAATDTLLVYTICYNANTAAKTRCTTGLPGWHATSAGFFLAKLRWLTVAIGNFARIVKFGNEAASNWKCTIAVPAESRRTIVEGFE